MVARSSELAAGLSLEDEKIVIPSNETLIVRNRRQLNELINTTMTDETEIAITRIKLRKLLFHTWIGGRLAGITDWRASLEGENPFKNIDEDDIKAQFDQYLLDDIARLNDR